MPAAAVIPAPIAYVKVVAVKKLVVGLVCAGCGDLRPKGRCDHARPGAVKFATGSPLVLIDSVASARLLVYCEKIGVFKAGVDCN